MKDLTKGPIVSHLLLLATPIAAHTLMQLSYHVICLYFVSKLGVAATAGVNIASSITFAVTSLAQVLGVGTTTVIAHAIGAKNQANANLAFNQSMALAAISGAAIMLIAYASIHFYLKLSAADAATISSGTTFLCWSLLGFGLIFPATVIAAALRCTGVVRPIVAIYAVTIIINAILAPVLITGWGIGRGLGVLGAGLTTTLSTLLSLVLLCTYLHRMERYLVVAPALMRPRFEQWRRILSIGLPAGTELALLSVSTTVIYAVIRDFGASAQAGFGIGSRVMQVILIPGVAIAFAVGPIVGQNFGAQHADRVRETFYKAVAIGAVVMTATTVLLQWWPEALVTMFDADASTMVEAVLFLRLNSWSFMGLTLVYTCSSAFQGIGNTVPPFMSSVARFAVFTVLAVWVSMQPGFRIEHVWYLWTGSVMLQAMISVWLLRLELKKRLLPTEGARRMLVTLAD